MSLLALLVPSARAAPIEEEDFLDALGDEHVAVRALAEGLGRAEAERIRAGTLANPRLEYWREEPDASPRVTNWSVTWVPPLDGRRRLGIEAAEKGLEAARARNGVDRTSLRREARAAFADWSFSFERLELLRRQLELVEHLARQQRDRAALGETSGLAARRFLLAAGEVRASLRDAQAEYVAAQAAARAWRPDLAPGVTPAPMLLPPAPVLPAAADGPEVRALTAELAQAGLEVRRTRRFWGSPTLQLGRQTIDDGDAVHDGPIVAAGWSLPLVDRDKAARLQAERRQDVLAARLEWARTRFAGEVEGALKAYEVRLGSALENRDAAGETDRIIEGATAAFRAGETDMTDLLETLRAALAAKLREIDARSAALGTHRVLEVVLGRALESGGDR